MKLIIINKVSQELDNTEKQLKRVQKWNFRAEKNNVIKEIYNNNNNTNVSMKGQLTPSVDEWLKMNKNEKRRNSIVIKRN